MAEIQSKLAPAAPGIDPSVSPLLQMYTESYSDMPLQDFVQKVYQQHYSDMPFDQFAQKSGLSLAMGLQDLSAMTRDPKQAAFNTDVEKAAQQLLAARGTSAFSVGAAGIGRAGFGDILSHIANVPIAAIDSWGHPDQFGRAYDVANAAERRAQQIQEQASPTAAMLGNFAGGLAVGGAAPGGAVPGMGQMITEGAALGGASGLGQGDTMHDRLTNAVTGGAVGGALGGLGGAVGNWLAQRGAAPAAAGSGAEAVQAAANLGVNIPAIAATDSRATQMLGQGIGGTFAGAPIPRSLQAANEDLGTVANGLAQTIGNAGNRVTAGTGLSRGLNDFVQNVSPARVSGAYNAVDALVNPAVTTDLNNTLRTVQDIVARRQAGGLPGNGGAANLVLEATTRPNGLTYQGVRDLRSNIGEMLKGGILPENFSGAEASRIYASLSDDLGRAAANAGGQDALRAWQVANRYARISAGRNERLAALIGNKSEEGLFNAVLSAAQTGGSENARLLNLVRSAVPAQQWDEVGSSFIAGLGRDPTTNAFSPARFLTDYSKISEAGRNALFNPGLRRALDDMATVATRLRGVDRLANYSRTGNVGSASAFTAGLVTAPLTTLTTALGANAMARLMARPAAVRAITTVAQRNASSGMIRAASVVIAKELGQANTGPQIEAALLKAYQGQQAPDQPVGGRVQ